MTPPDSAPFDDMRSLILALRGPDLSAKDTARALRAQLALPSGGTGRLGVLFDWLAGVTGRCPPTFRFPRLALYAGRHGAADHDPLTPDAAHVRRHLELLAAGGGLANAVCAAGDVGLQVFDLSPETPPQDPALGPSMTERDCAAAMAFGMEALAGEVDLLCLGDISAGAEFGAAAILEPAIVPVQWSSHIAPATDDPLEALRRFGGRETAALAGAILAAGHQKMPVILDGAPALAAACVLWRQNAHALDHCLLAEARGGIMERAAAEMGLVPLLSFGLSAGEGAAAALAVQTVRTAVSLHLSLPPRHSMGL